MQLNVQVQKCVEAPQQTKMYSSLRYVQNIFSKQPVLKKKKIKNTTSSKLCELMDSKCCSKMDKTKFNMQYKMWAFPWLS